MPELLKLCLFICPLIFLGGFVDSVAGGGGLITLPAYLMAGLPVHLAAGTNKVVNGSGSAIASVKYFRSGKIQLRPSLWAAAGALAGASFGARIAMHLSDRVLQGLMLVALPVVAVFLVVKKDFGKDPEEHPGGTGDVVHRAPGGGLQHPGQLLRRPLRYPGRRPADPDYDLCGAGDDVCEDAGGFD